MKHRVVQMPILLLAAAGLLTTSGCVKKDEYNAVVAERDALARTVKEQEAVLGELQADFAKLTEIFAEEIESQELQLQQLVSIAYINALSGLRLRRHNIQYREIRLSACARRAERVREPRRGIRHSSMSHARTRA